MTPRALASNVRQARKLRVLTWAFTALACAALIWGYFDLSGLVLAPFGALFAAALHGYMRRYVVSLEQDGDVIIVRTAGVWAPVLRFERARIGPRTFHEGRGRYGTMASEDAPWITLPIAGVRFPFVIDAQIEVLDLEGIKRL